MGECLSKLCGGQGRPQEDSHELANRRRQSQSTSGRHGRADQRAPAPPRPARPAEGFDPSYSGSNVTPASIAAKSRQTATLTSGTGDYQAKSQAHRTGEQVANVQGHPQASSSTAPAPRQPRAGTRTSAIPGTLPGERANKWPDTFLAAPEDSSSDAQSGLTMFEDVMPEASEEHREPTGPVIYPTVRPDSQARGRESLILGGGPRGSSRGRDVAGGTGLSTQSRTRDSDIGGRLTVPGEIPSSEGSACSESSSGDNIQPAPRSSIGVADTTDKRVDRHRERRRR